MPALFSSTMMAPTGRKRELWSFWSVIEGDSSRAPVVKQLEIPHWL
jgi:hypothetical protein